MKESELEKKFCLLVGQAGGKAYKFVSPGNTGVPDRLVILPGARVGFVELKKPGGELRKQQEFRRRELGALGCFTAVVDSVESAEAVIGEISRQEPRAQHTDKLFQEMVNRSPGRKGVIV